MVQGNDPTNGYVEYVNRDTAASAGYCSNWNGLTYIGVDNTHLASGSGRQSVRLESKSTYEHSLIVIDLAHMPGSVCGSWPAL